MIHSPLSRPTPRIPRPCRLPSPRQLWTRITARSTASGPASASRPPPPVRWAWASSWTAVTAARPAPGRWGMCALRRTRATTTKDCTVTTARTSLGTKKECVHVSVTQQNRQTTDFTQQVHFLMYLRFPVQATARTRLCFCRAGVCCHIYICCHSNNPGVTWPEYWFSSMQDNCSSHLINICYFSSSCICTAYMYVHISVWCIVNHFKHNDSCCMSNNLI